MDRDIEQGIVPDENSPLLTTQEESPNLNAIQKSKPKHPALQNLELDPSSVLSTPDSSPADTAGLHPRKWRRSDRRTRRLNTELLSAVETQNVAEIERLLKAGANPNATCRLDFVSACHIAAMSGGDGLALLMKHGAEKHRLDVLGRTPLHLAAYAGNVRQVAILLGYSEEMQDRIAADDMSSAEDEVKKLTADTQAMANVRCDVGHVNLVLPKNWKDNIDHNCMSIKGSLPLLQPGWTPLHVAVSCARLQCTRLLLAAGADPNLTDEVGRTPLDVVGSGYYHNVDINVENFTEVIKLLVKAGGAHNTMQRKGLNNINTPLHTAVELKKTDAITELLDLGVSVGCLNVEGETPMHLCVNKRLQEPLQVLANYEYLNADPMVAMIDMKDKYGYTVLQEAIEQGWVPGVCIALEAGADVSLKSNDGETPVHTAAELGNIDILLEILSIAKQKGVIDCQNDEGDTPLFKAIKNKHLECVKALIEEGACLKIKSSGEVNVLHIAANSGDADILKILLQHNEAEVLPMINSLTSIEKQGLGPIHFAVINDNVDCVKILLSQNADIRLRTTENPHSCSTPLHIAAAKNCINVAKFIVKYDKTTIHEVNSKGWFPLHMASHNGSRDVILLFLQEGANLSEYTDGPKKYRCSALDMILTNLSKPTEFMEEVFDLYINSNTANFHDQNCEITVDYRILLPTVCEMEQMKVIKALIRTGNRYGQMKLLIHPLVESFLYLKWKVLLPFFYVIIALYSLLVSSLTIFTISVYFYGDTASNPPTYLSPTIWANVIYISVVLLILQELLYMNFKNKTYFLQLETWVKFGTIGLAVALPSSLALAGDADWPRQIATLAILFSWIELMFLLSRFPTWGYYVLMFGKVAINVVKILLTFAFIIIGFSLSFMIQFHTQTPFESPWAAFIKTIVMMTSEFDYQALFEQRVTNEITTSMVIVRLIFLLFVVLAAIVIMNLMVGVAVSDINDLAMLGKIDRLGKQVQFLSTLDNLVYNRVFALIIPNRIINHIKRKRRVVNTIILAPSKPKWKYYKALPSHLREAIFNLALEKMKQKDDEINMAEFTKKIDEMHETISKFESKDKNSKQMVDCVSSKENDNQIMDRLNNIDISMENMKEQIKTAVEETKSPLIHMNKEMQQMYMEIQGLKTVLANLEKKLS